MWEEFSFRVLTWVVCGTLSYDQGSVLSCYAILASPCGLWKSLQHWLIGLLLSNLSLLTTLLAYLEEGRHGRASLLIVLTKYNLGLAMFRVRVMSRFLPTRRKYGGCPKELPYLGSMWTGY